MIFFVHLFLFALPECIRYKGFVCVRERERERTSDHFGRDPATLNGLFTTGPGFDLEHTHTQLDHDPQ